MITAVIIHWTFQWSICLYCSWTLSTVQFVNNQRTLPQIMRLQQRSNYCRKSWSKKKGWEMTSSVEDSVKDDDDDDEAERHGWMTLLSSVDNDTVISWCQHYQHFLINIFYQHLSPPLSTAWGEHCWSLELCCWQSTLSWPVPRKGRGSSTRSGRISTGTMRSRRWASVTFSPRRASDCTL